jgi:putative FmdB family regulatory protein
MPLYEYTCQKCAHTFETLVSGKREESVRCPECNSDEIEQMIGLPAKGRVVEGQPATNCPGDGPPCGAPWCGRKNR